MARPKSQTKKLGISISLTPNQLRLLRWISDESGESGSATIGRLIETEAQRITKRTGKSPETTVWTPDKTAAASVRDLISAKTKKEG